MKELTPEQASKLEALKTEIESLSSDLEANVELFNEKTKNLWNDYIRDKADKLNAKIEELRSLRSQVTTRMGNEPDTNTIWYKQWLHATLTDLDFEVPCITAAESEYNISLPVELRFDGDWDLDIYELIPKPE